MNKFGLNYHLKDKNPFVNNITCHLAEYVINGGMEPLAYGFKPCPPLNSHKTPSGRVVTTQYQSPRYRAHHVYDYLGRVRGAAYVHSAECAVEATWKNVRGKNIKGKVNL